MASPQEDRPQSSPGAMHVASRAIGRAPEWGIRLQQQRQEQLCEQQRPPPPTKHRSIVTMRHVQKHLPVVEGELMTAEEQQMEQGEEESVCSLQMHELIREDTETTVEISDRSAQSMEHSSGDLSESSAKDAILGSAKAFFKGGLSKMSKKRNKKIGKQQTSPSTNGRRISRERLLAQPSLLLPPDMVEAVKIAAARDLDGGSINGNNNATDGRPTLARTNRNIRRLPSEASIPEEDASISGGGHGSSFGVPTDKLVGKKEEGGGATQNEGVIDQILEVFPDADRHQTLRWVNEGQSVRHIIGELCHARRSSFRPTLTQQSEDQQSEKLTGSFQSLDLEEAVDDSPEIATLVQQIQEAFPDVDVDRSYAMLRKKSLHEVMIELAEESLNNFGGHINLCDDGAVDEMTLQHAQDAFPHVQRAELKSLLRERSLSGVMIQLLDGIPSENVQQTGYLCQERKDSTSSTLSVVTTNLESLDEASTADNSG